MRKVTKRDMEKMMARCVFTHDSEISEKAKAPAWRDEEGNILIKVAKGSGIFWERAELQELLASIRRGPYHFLEGLISSGMEFERNIPRQIDAMATAFDLGMADLDFSVESIRKIDERLNNPAFWASRYQYFEGILGYVGEVIRRAQNGKWNLRLGFDGRTVEPWIVTSNGQSLQLFYLIFDELHEQAGTQSLYGRVRILFGMGAR